MELARYALQVTHAPRLLERPAQPDRNQPRVMLCARLVPKVPHALQQVPLLANLLSTLTQV